ncbi:MAG: response regulator [Tepidisphaeraceae bacterium]
MGDGQGLRILLVEDDADSREALRRLLARQGHEVHVSTDYQSALDVASRQTLDVLLSDIGLPGRDGCELMRAVKKLYNMPGVALTAFVSAEDEARCKAAGFAHFLDKPVQFSEVLNVVSKFPRREA